jgi:hypothetical protein
MANRKAVRIEIEYDDGAVEFAEGEAADEILRWYGACQTMACIHGAKYHGAQFIERPKMESR